MKRDGWIVLCMTAVALSLLLIAGNLFLGPLNQDEGWYLYAAGRVASGEVLYRDFMFTQGPALPVVYSLVFPVIDRLGVAGGRLITAVFGFSAALCAAWLAGRLVPSTYRRAVQTAALILIGVNVYQSYFTTVVKTYSLCAFFLTGGFAALTYADGRRGRTAAFIGGVFLALAACTRLSAGIALLVAGLWLIRNRSSFKSAWLFFGLGGGLMLLAGLGTFFLLSPGNTRFALFGYHAARGSAGLLQSMVLKAGFVSRFVQAFFVFSGGCAVALFLRFYAAKKTAPEKGAALFFKSPDSLLWITGAAVTLVHLSAPFPYDDYQTIVYPLLAAALSASLVPHLSEKYVRPAVSLLLLLCLAASFSSPLNQEWFVSGRDRIWWRFKETPDLIALRRAGRQIREKLGEESLLMTQDTYLAVEARAQVPRGMEMGPFCYYPGVSRRQAETLNLLNEERMTELLKQADAPVAAFSGYGLSIASPQIRELSSEEQARLRKALETRYKKTAQIESFGQAHTTLEIFERTP